MGKGNTKKAIVDSKNIIVTVTYRNESLVPVCQREYPLDEYTSIIKNDIMRIITDVEDTIYDITGQKKSEWPSGVLLKFEKIKHKLLDKAGEIGRLTGNMTYNVETPVYVDDLSEDVRSILGAIGIGSK
jgi:hypothetical protein